MLQSCYGNRSLLPCLVERRHPNWSGNANIFNTIAFENADWQLINGTLAYNVKLNAGERVWVVVTNNQTGNPYQ